MPEEIESQSEALYAIANLLDQLAADLAGIRSRVVQLQLLTAEIAEIQEHKERDA